jgi:membrane-associated phospholipid phosphatase
MTAATAGARATLGLLACLALPVAVVRAADRPAPVYDVSWVWDGAVIAGAAALAGGLELAAPALIDRSCTCRPDEVSGFDSVSLHHDSAALARASHVLVGALLAAPFALDAADLAGAVGWSRAWAEDAAVMAEAIAVNVAATGVIKPAVQRPRPVLYRVGPDDPAHDDRDSYVSFYSGHTSLAFAAGMSYATTFALRHPSSPWRVVLFAGAAAAGAATGLLRIYAGRHFPTDVMVGAVAGSAIGLGVPWLHRRRTVQLTGWPVGAGGAMLGVTGRL